MAAVPAALLLAAWQALVFVLPRLEFFVGSPRGIARAALASLMDTSLLVDAGVTSAEAVLGFAIGGLLGTVIGIVLWWFPSAERVSRPYLVAFGAVPIFALGPILIFWLGTGLLSKAVIGALATLVVAASQVVTGAREADQDLIDVIFAYGGSKRDAFRSVALPSAVIWVLAGARYNIGVALLSAFIGEFLASTNGLGHRIVVAEGLYDVSAIWVGVIGIMIISTLFYALTLPFELVTRRWKVRS